MYLTKWPSSLHESGPTNISISRLYPWACNNQSTLDKFGICENRSLKEVWPKKVIRIICGPSFLQQPVHLDDLDHLQQKSCRSRPSFLQQAGSFGWFGSFATEKCWDLCWACDISQITTRHFLNIDLCSVLCYKVVRQPLVKKLEKLEETLMILTLKLSLSKVATFVTVFFSSSFQPFPLIWTWTNICPKILTLTWNWDHVGDPKLDGSNKK